MAFNIVILCLFVYFVVVSSCYFSKDRLIFSCIGLGAAIMGLLFAIAMQFDTEILYVIAYSLQFPLLGASTAFSTILAKHNVVKGLSIAAGITGVVISILLGL